MKLTRRRLLMGLSAASAAALSACTGSNGPSGSNGSNPGAVSGSGELSGEITFQTWSLKDDRFTPYFEALIKAFQDDNPGTTINWIDQPGDGYEEKILQQANSGELPDVINLPEGFAYKLAQVSQLLDLRAADADILGTYVQGGLDAYTYDGIEGVYGYPWYLGTDVCWWNTEMLEQAGLSPEDAPADLDAYIDWCTTAADKGVYLASTMPGLMEIRDYGVEIFDGTQFTFNTDRAAQIVGKYAELYRAGAMPSEVLNDDYAGNATMYTQEKVGYTTATGSFVTQLTNDAPTLLDKTDCSARFTTPPLYIQGITVAANSGNPALALAFAQYVTNNENQVAFVKIAQGFMPGTLAGNNDPESFTGDVSDPLMKKAIELAAAAMPDAETVKPVQYTDDMSTYTQQQIALAMKGDLSPKEALDAAVAYCNENLNV
ncbi:extracellular solute-binding protein [Actinomyces qiguomingii]|uniref:extracellular solute-binding protein n=1 Tax=Actinomyces qiguomingii TaxID=2057800 RepID=UPI000CA0832A|nr:extracellular solute-binding protein [Actinomyces qiguomingii]